MQDNPKKTLENYLNREMKIKILYMFIYLMNSMQFLDLEVNKKKVLRNYMIAL